MPSHRLFESYFLWILADTARKGTVIRPSVVDLEWGPTVLQVPYLKQYSWFCLELWPDVVRTSGSRLQVLDFC